MKHQTTTRFVDVSSGSELSGASEPELTIPRKHVGVETSEIATCNKIIHSEIFQNIFYQR